MRERARQLAPHALRASASYHRVLIWRVQLPTILYCTVSYPEFLLWGHSINYEHVLNTHCTVYNIIYYMGSMAHLLYYIIFLYTLSTYVRRKPMQTN